MLASKDYAKTTNDHDVFFTELGLLLFGILWPAWGYLSYYFYQTKNDGLIERLPYFFLCVGLILISRKKQWSLRKTRVGLNFIMWLVTLHLHLQNLQSPLNLMCTTGTIANLIGVCSAMINRKELALYTVFNITISYFAFRAIEGLDWQLMWLFTITIHSYFFVGVHFRTLLRDLLYQSNEKNQIMGSLAIQAAHDIRSPITALNLVMTSKNVARLDPEEKSLIKLSLNRILRISEDLLERNRELRHLSKKNIKFNLEDALLEIIEEKRGVFKNCFIEFRALEHTTLITGDKAKLQRALSNIMNNSYEARQTDCKITVEVCNYMAGVVIDISDNGPGIPKHLIPMIFQNEVISTKNDNSGIGLISAKKQLQDLGLSIELLKTGPTGTTFRIVEN